MIKELKEKAEKEIKDFVNEHGIFWSIGIVFMVIIGIIYVIG